MKNAIKITLTVPLLFLTLTMVNAQNEQTTANDEDKSVSVVTLDKEPLMGPEAKNAKAWDKKAYKKNAMASYQQDRLQGPKAKNRKAGQKKKVYDKVLVSKVNKKRLMGPKAKNAKPWDN